MIVKDWTPLVFFVLLGLAISISAQDDCPAFPDPATPSNDGCPCLKDQDGDYTSSACKGHCCINGECSSGVKCTSILILALAIAGGVLFCCCLGICAFCYFCTNAASSNQRRYQPQPAHMNAAQQYAGYR
eukprot:m.336835 g.336835  ORF g.336835 m.336835 type:complete len:130 (-) comp17971_c0_seq1:74-463(-)